MLWSVGVIIFLIMMGTAFIGYEYSLKWLNNKEEGIGIMGVGAVVGKGEGEEKEENSEEINTAIKELGINPEYVYENLELEGTRKRILKETKGLSGIYMIYNKITKDYYVGSASTNRFYARFSNHLIDYRGSKIVKLVVKKYKLENLAFMILERFPEVVNRENNKRLIDMEDRYLKRLLPNYNILTEAGSSFGYKHIEIDRIKMREIYSEERRERIGKLNRGRKFSKETIERMREAALRRPKMTEETRKKCISNTRPVVLYNLNGTIYGEYKTRVEAGKATNSSERTIRRALKTDKKILRRKWILKELKEKG